MTIEKVMNIMGVVEADADSEKDVQCIKKIHKEKAKKDCLGMTMQFYRMGSEKSI